MSILNLISDEELKILSIDQIKQIIGPKMRGLTIQTPIISKGTFLYRARKLGGSFQKNKEMSISELTYPPVELATIGRVNRENSSLFYCSLSKEAVFYELPLNVGNEIILSFWQVHKDIIVNNIGYTQKTFNQLSAKRICPKWTVSTNANISRSSVEDIDPTVLEKIKLGAGENADLLESLSSAFMCNVDENNVYRYKLTVAIAECHLGDICNSNEKINGILYPSVRTMAEEDNLAINPAFADQYLILKKAMHIRIDDKSEKNFSITMLDQAALGNDESLVWLGGLPTSPIMTACTITAVAGVDNNGDYFRSTEGIPCHWRIIDENTGVVHTFT